MDLSPDLDNYILESIAYTVGLPVSSKTLELKLAAAEEAKKQLQRQVSQLEARLKEKDEKIHRARTEATMIAKALRKYIGENQNLSAEHKNLLHRCRNLEENCVLYHQDREALMEFGNNADERAKEAENSCRILSEELGYCKQESKMHMVNEARAAEELRLLRRRIDELERARLQGGSDSDLACRQCSSLKENKERESHVFATVLGKQKSSSTATSSTDKNIEFCGPDSPRQPLSPLQQNSFDSRMCKKQR